ncbi:TlpA disulfide reductase family protein [Empedobacter falsenii]|nr:TlpA disulfide reductase family protein [Empedobacter falsenii]
MKLILFVFINIFFLNITFAQDGEYKIKGEIKGFPDNTWIYLSDLSDDSYKKIDSAKVINNHIELKGKLVSNVFFASIHTNDYENRIKLWIDKTPIKINLEKDNFDDGVIIGSITQKKYIDFYKSIENIENSQKQYLEFIKNNPSSILSVYFLRGLKNKVSKDSLILAFEQLNKDVKKSIYGVEISDFINFKKDIKIGNQFVDFEMANISDKNIRLSDFKEKIVLLDFWATWCGSCIEDLPNLKTIYDKYKSKGFEILGVSADSKKESLVNVINKFSIPWENVSDYKGAKNKASIIYNITEYPTNYLINKEGIIIAKDVNGKELEKVLNELL